MPLLFLLLVGVPIFEVYLLIKIGSEIGAFTTVLLIVATAALGAVFIRIQGISTLSRLRQQAAMGTVPGQAMLDAAALLLAGIFLLTPGFFTDTIGFLLLIPAVRRSIFRALIKRIFVISAVENPNTPPSIRIIKGEVEKDE